ncbi:tRNA (adenosine(37)-N6)-threonylcarbamoyltransferase complex ATPase subunit type 1 TsaE [Olegusella massiliensis]|uniref:tRNA (adenosine(37)-N6)-threonylcarbamoyltransferase complex ATPase subunit type 1 TsaE n=1 Tax=Olegusella massiliensis TaxID=1776381 RepID=UPI000A779CDF|nr:tRNA (adenosine(37)-N6)-threonylcarbamoyltransferase complex ATPase subunit type 1 TsaE [Olegusella massiliensis]
MSKQPMEEGLCIKTQSTEETIEFGRTLGAQLAPGDVLILTGDLGAGKTQLTKGIADALGVEDDVTSPTFTIEMVYEGKDMPLYHFDLYRLDDSDQLEDTGLFDVLGGDGVCVIEWGEQFADEIGDERLDIYLSRLDDEVEAGQEPPRKLCLVPRCPRATSLLSCLA